MHWLTYSVATILLLTSATATAQTVYRWVDDKGVVQYGDQPPATAKSLQKKAIASNSSGAVDLPYATQLAMQNFPVTVFVGDGCPACKEGVALLSKRGVPFALKNITVNPYDTEDLKKINDGNTSVPVLLVGKQKHVGLLASQWQSLLDIAGYPASAYRPSSPTLTPAVSTPQPAAEDAQGAAPQ